MKHCFIIFPVIICFIFIIITTSNAQKTFTIQMDSTTFIFGRTCFVVNFYEDTTWFQTRFVDVVNDTVYERGHQSNGEPPKPSNYVVTPLYPTVDSEWWGIHGGIPSRVFVKDYKSITVPAGTFSTYMYEVTDSLSGEYEGNMFFADDVGLIYQSSVSDSFSMVLSSYTIVGGYGVCPINVGNEWIFVEGVYQALQVIATVPEQNAIHVPLSTDITATFNIDINESTINDSTVLIHGSQTGKKAGSLIYDPNSKTVKFIPEIPFKTGELVKVILTNRIQNSTGIGLAGGFSWEFLVRTKRSSLDFKLLEQYNAGIFPNCLYTGDLDQDTDIDIAVAENSAPGNLFIYTNKGSADFVLHNKFTGVYYPTHMNGVDLDGDGDLDLATSNHDSDNSGFVVVWQNKGGATFEMTNYFGYATDFGHSWLCSHDFDGDGDFDLAASVGMASKVSILFNNGEGTFGNPVIYDVGDQPNSLVCADFDLDGDMDIAVAKKNSNKISIMGNASGQFTLDASYIVGNNPYSITTADFDGDRYAEIATFNSNSDNVSMLLNNGDGSFATAINYSVPPHPHRMIANDFDGDGDIDIAMIIYNSNIVYLLCNNGEGNFSEGGSFSIGISPEAFQTADFDGDADLDFILTNGDYSGGTVTVYINEGIGPEPKILSIKDVTNDEGRQVRIVWRRSLYDTFDIDTSITFYSLWRRVDDYKKHNNIHKQDIMSEKIDTNKLLFNKQFLPIENGKCLRIQAYDALWDFIANINAVRHNEYAFVAPTLADSTDKGIYWSVFYIVAHTQNPDVFFKSAPDSGYSVDNLSTKI